MTAKSDNTRDNEQNKFVNDSNGDVAVNTVTEFSGSAFDDISAGAPSIFNITMTNASTEYSFSLPEGTNSFKLKIKNNKSKFDISYVSGGTTFSVPRGTIYEESGLNLDAITTIYFTANKGNLVMEIITWK